MSNQQEQDELKRRKVEYWLIISLIIVGLFTAYLLNQHPDDDFYKNRPDVLATL